MKKAHRFYLPFRRIFFPKGFIPQKNLFPLRNALKQDLEDCKSSGGIGCGSEAGSTTSTAMSGNGATSVIIAKICTEECRSVPHSMSTSAMSQPRVLSSNQ